MVPREPDTLSVLETILFSLFAGVGGSLAYVLRTLNQGKPLRGVRIVVEGLSASFVGLLAMLACKAVGLPWEWSGVVVGLFGWLGAETSIVLLAGLVRSKLGLDPAPPFQDPFEDYPGYRYHSTQNEPTVEPDSKEKAEEKAEEKDLA